MSQFLSRVIIGSSDKSYGTASGLILKLTISLVINISYFLRIRRHFCQRCGDGMQLMHPQNGGSGQPQRTSQKHWLSNSLLSITDAQSFLDKHVQIEILLFGRKNYNWTKICCGTATFKKLTLLLQKIF